MSGPEPHSAASTAEKVASSGSLRDAAAAAAPEAETGPPPSTQDPGCPAVSGIVTSWINQNPRGALSIHAQVGPLLVLF